jgi:site-specific recombinase XerD
MKTPYPQTSFPTLLQQFFVERLIQQRNASTQTVTAYRDSFRLLLQFAQHHLGKAPERLALTDLDAPLILAFLNHLEGERHNTIRSRNARFAAIRSFLHFAAFKDPASLPVIQRALAIPMKRFDKPLLGFLSRAEMQAILDAPDCTSWCGQRDRVMFATLYNTGGRVSEITGLQVGDVILDGTAAVRIRGKGRKERSVPLWRTTTTEIRKWLPRINGKADQPLFPGWSGARMTRPAVTARLQLAVQSAAASCPQLAKRRVSPHIIRHSTAMHMLQAGVDITLIALWLGHENPATTHMYVEADLAMKERALKAVQAPDIKQTRYQPTDRVLEFLRTL